MKVMQFNNPYLSPKQKIEMLQRWILVHSYIYYELNNNAVEDAAFDNNCNHLARLQKAYPKALKQSRYYYAMKEFDGSTGYGFVNKLNSEMQDIIRRDAQYIIDHFIYKEV